VKGSELIGPHFPNAYCISLFPFVSTGLREVISFNHPISEHSCISDTALYCCWPYYRTKFMFLQIYLLITIEATYKERIALFGFVT
jgi:hypothetical protein